MFIQFLCTIVLASSPALPQGDPAQTCITWLIHQPKDAWSQQVEQTLCAEVKKCKTENDFEALIAHCEGKTGKFYQEARVLIKYEYSRFLCEMAEDQDSFADSASITVGQSSHATLARTSARQPNQKPAPLTPLLKLEINPTILAQARQMVAKLAPEERAEMYQVLSLHLQYSGYPNYSIWFPSLLYLDASSYVSSVNFGVQQFIQAYSASQQAPVQLFSREWWEKVDSGEIRLTIEEWMEMKRTGQVRIF